MLCTELFMQTLHKYRNSLNMIPIPGHDIEHNR